MSAIATDSSAIVGGGEAKRTSSRIQNRPSPPLAVFCGLTVDRSGSMSNLFMTAAGGVYNCIQDQIQGAQENGQIGHLFLTTFDNHINKIHDNTNFKDLDIKMEDVLTWMKPRGCTRLYDAAIQDLDNIMTAVEEYKENLSPEVKKLNPTISTVWVCCTDGFDNDSNRTCEDFRKKEIEWKNRDHALFVGYMPSTKPKYSISVVIEHGGSGASTAAPIAKKIFNYINKIEL